MTLNGVIALTTATSGNRLAKFHANILNLSENIAKSFSGATFFDSHCRWKSRSEVQKLEQTLTSNSSGDEIANVNSSSCSLYVIVRPSVCLSSVCRLSSVWNVRAPFSGDWNFRQCFYAMWYLLPLAINCIVLYCIVLYPWPLYKKFTEIVPE